MAESNRDSIDQRRRIRPIMLQVCLGLSMVALSHRAMLVALPTLTHAFDTDLSSIQWALLVYDLAVIGLVLTLGRLGDLFGRKPIYMWGFVVFAVGSAVCGLVQNPVQLVAFRIVQGIGGAMIMANGRALASNVYPPAERGKALGLTSTAYHVGYMAGPTLGGFIIDTVGWRWIFFVNVPIALACAYLARRVLRDRAPITDDIRVDVAGAAYLLLGNISLVYALNQLPHLGYTHPAVLSLLALAVAALFMFIRTELRVDTPILNLELFRSRLFSAANLSLFFITSTQSGIGVLLPFYLQNLIGFTPSQMGWIIIANSVVIVMVAPIAGRLSDRLGSRLLCSVGSAFIVAGQFLIASLDLQSTIFQMVLPQMLSGLGWAIFNSPNQSAILGSVPRDKVGAAAGMTVTTARVGGAIGIALSGALLTYALGASGLSAPEVESPQTWGAHPVAFLRAFSTTVHVVNIFAVLAIVFSGLRGDRSR
jgi:EmrB/QacA subfamily drug resistance transporter